MTSNLPPFIQRLIEEKNQLLDRVTKLSAFTGSDGFKKLDVTDQYLLYEQLNHMNIYLSILVRRLNKLLDSAESKDINQENPDE